MELSNIDCGSLTRIDRGGIHLKGPIRLGARLDGVLALIKHPRAGTSGDHPDYLAEYTPQGGSPRPAGAAWNKHSDRIGGFISISLDDPDWPSPINLTAFPIKGDQDNPTWVIVWSRPRGPRAPEQDAPLA
jgi:uncharacterized protein (DUF736 family)